MFTVTSRYQALPTAQYLLPSGATVVYVLRRYLPQPAELAQLSEHVVTPGELGRLDLVAAAEAASPELFWQIADANRGMDPADLVSTAGRRLRITLPAGIGPGISILGTRNG